MVDYFVAVSRVLYNLRLYLKQGTTSHTLNESSSEKLINRPVILTLVCSEPEYLCNGQKWVKRALSEFAAVSDFPVFIALEAFSEINVFVCVSGIPDSINILKLQASCPDHTPSLCPKLRNSY